MWPWLLSGTTPDQMAELKENPEFWSHLKTRPAAFVTMFARCGVTQKEFKARGGPINGSAFLTKACELPITIRTLAANYCVGRSLLHLNNWAPFRAACNLGNLDLAQWLYRRGGMKPEDTMAQKEYALRVARKNHHADLECWLSQEKLSVQDAENCTRSTEATIPPEG
jgi:hypothetical protein